MLKRTFAKLCKTTVAEAYEQLVRRGAIENNPHQRRMAESCTPLLNMIRSSSVHPVKPTLTTSHNVSNLQTNFKGMFSSFQDRLQRALAPENSSSMAIDFPYMETVNIGVVEKRGLYLWGDVGIGKTMVLDLFFGCETKLPKRRAHLHSFMSDIAERLVQADLTLKEMKKKATPSDLARLKALRPMDLVVADILTESPILCFDEFQTFDVAHAALLAAFFKTAFHRGLFLITTSNRHPEELCKVSSSFSSFLPILNAYCEIVHCGDIPDYRTPLEWERRHDNVFLYPGNKSVSEAVLKRLERGIQGREVHWIKDDYLYHHGRTTRIPYHCGGIAMFDFQDICGDRLDLASIDFQLLAKAYHTIFISNVPQIGTSNRNAAQQFVILVDELYQHRVKLVMTCKVPWSHLLDTTDFFTGLTPIGKGSDAYYSDGDDDRIGMSAVYDFKNEEEIMSFSRIKSRLNEMGSRRYLLQDHTDFVVCDFNFGVLVE
ncbi:AFG1-like ATPase, putative [Angomonas deanei]|uniref:AFG1-like ATPase, putative n=1 Tax=Angomonas deanei TaxID=59799 RepID=A0A7G2C231_9TRYP|nr:AFG1-like ATPase, putative [Angomonas deanei]